MSVTGPVEADNAIVFGEVTFSSMTVSSMTVRDALTLPDSYGGVAGRIQQLKYRVASTSTTTTSTTFTPVDATSQTITLSQPGNLVRITLSGTILSDPPANTGVQFGRLTIYRGGVNLGHPTNGFAFATGLSGDVGAPADYPGNTNARIVIVDSPGDTLPHTYEARICTTNATSVVSFPYQTNALLILEEISQ